MERTVIARWESKRGKDWLELYEDKHGMGYEANGAGGFLGKVTRERAIEDMEQRIANGMYCSQKTPMKRTV
jgi:hypothetical protein